MKRYTVIVRKSSTYLFSCQCDFIKKTIFISYLQFNNHEIVQYCNYETFHENIIFLLYKLMKSMYNYFMKFICH